MRHSWDREQTSISKDSSLNLLGLGFGDSSFYFLGLGFGDSSFNFLGLGFGVLGTSFGPGAQHLQLRMIECRLVSHDAG